MIAKIDLTGKQVARINSNPNVYRHAGAQLMGEQLVGNEALRKALKDWIAESGEVTLEIDLQPILDQIDGALEKK